MPARWPAIYHKGAGVKRVLVLRLPLAIVLVLVLAGCGSSDGSGTDAGAEAACRQFGNVAHDADAGILTDTELRQKLKEVYDNASVSNDGELRHAAERMLADVTPGSAAPAALFEQDAQAFVDACQRLGLTNQ